jgi:hypothetical protein
MPDLVTYLRDFLLLRGSGGLSLIGVSVGNVGFSIGIKLPPDRCWSETCLGYNDLMLCLFTLGHHEAQGSYIKARSVDHGVCRA